VRARWLALPRSRRLWVISGLPVVPAILLIVLLGLLYGRTRYWTVIYLSIAVAAFIIGMIIWLIGTIRAVQELRAHRADHQTGR
jgi:hypothetical protein